MRRVTDLSSTHFARHGAPGGPSGSGPACSGRCTFRRAGSAERPEIEAFIRRGFERAYRARITRFMPRLMSLRRDSRLAAACGLRSAAAEPLFLETYLDRPIENALAAASGRPLARGSVIEVGNLVVARAGGARRLIIHLTSYLAAAGADWVVFTAVPALRNNFTRLGIPLVLLGAADSARLDADALADWGDYYAHGPRVTAVNVAAAFEAVRGASCTP
jgi:hypothetical protein